MYNTLELYVSQNPQHEPNAVNYTINVTDWSADDRTETTYRIKLTGGHGILTLDELTDGIITPKLIATPKALPLKHSIRRALIHYLNSHPYVYDHIEIFVDC